MPSLLCYMTHEVATKQVGPYGWLHTEGNLFQNPYPLPWKNSVFNKAVRHQTMLA